jgi:hypothetical protein
MEEDLTIGALDQFIHGLGGATCTLRRSAWLLFTANQEALDPGILG